MFFGIVISPMGWGIAFIMALIAIIAPYLLIDSATSYLPESIEDIAEFILCYVGMPLLMCWIYKKKMFGQGQGAALFWIYTTLYSLLAMWAISRAFKEELSLPNISGATILTLIAGGMIWWAFKTRKDYAIAVNEAEDAMYAAEREDQIQRQAEAILRAERMKEGKA